MSYNLRGFSKYGSSKTTCKLNHKHASKLEAMRCDGLTLLQKAKLIRNLQYQPKYKILEGFKYRGESIRPVYYIADFSYLDEKGNIVVEDTKGFKTPEYKLKRKLFLKTYGNIVFSEVRG